MMILRKQHRESSSHRSCFCNLLCWISLSLLPAAFVAGTERDQDPHKNRAAPLFASQKILRVDIHLDPEDWMALRTSHRIAEPGRIAEDPYKYYKADVDIDGVRIPAVGVRKKGFFGSVVSTRPSIKIRFDRWEKKQDFYGLDQLTLNNNVQDASQLHQYMAYWLFERAGTPSPRCNFALVTVNGEKLGIYSNVESIRGPFLDRVFKGRKGKLYEGYAGDFSEDPESFARIVRKNGKPGAGRKTLKRFLAVLQDARTGLREIEKHIDLEAFITFWATEVLIGHWDSYSGNRNNYYIYQEPRKDRLYFVPWGTDSIFWDPGPFIQQPVPKSFKAVGALCARLWKIPEVQHRYRREMRRLLDEVWIEEEIRAEVERVQKLLEPHLTVDSQRRNDRLETAFAFIRERRAEVEAELNQPAATWPQLAAPTPEEPPTEMELVGSFRAEMVDDAPENLFQSGTARLEVRIDGQEQERMFVDLGAYARQENTEFIRPGYPFVHLVAQDESGKTTWHLQFYLDPIRIAVAKESLPVDHFCVWAMVIQGDPDSPEAQRRTFGVTGTFDIKQFDNKIGGTVAGEFQLTTEAFQD